MPPRAQFAASAATYLLGIGLTVSGFTSPLFGYALIGLATLLLFLPIGHYVRSFARNRRDAGRQIVEPTDLLTAGAIGTAVFVVIAAIGATWYLKQPRAALTAPPPPAASTEQIKGLQGQIQTLRSEIQQLSTDADRGAKAARVIQLEEGAKKLEATSTTASELMVAITRWYTNPRAAGLPNRTYIIFAQLNMIFNEAQEIANAAYPEDHIQMLVEPSSSDILTKRAPEDDQVADNEQKFAYRKEYLKWERARAQIQPLTEKMKKETVGLRGALSRSRD